MSVVVIVSDPGHSFLRTGCDRLPTSRTLRNLRIPALRFAAPVPVAGCRRLLRRLFDLWRPFDIGDRLWGRDDHRRRHQHWGRIERVAPVRVGIRIGIAIRISVWRSVPGTAPDGTHRNTNADPGWGRHDDRAARWRRQIPPNARWWTPNETGWRRWAAYCSRRRRGWRSTHLSRRAGGPVKASDRSLALTRCTRWRWRRRLCRRLTPQHAQPGSNQDQTDSPHEPSPIQTQNSIPGQRSDGSRGRRRSHLLTSLLAAPQIQRRETVWRKRHCVRADHDADRSRQSDPPP